MEFKENQILEFFVEKQIKLSEEEYYILNLENKRKFLLPAAFYCGYNIKENSFIKCYINKINCNGQVFLEPLHPIYKIGDIDTFYLYKTEIRVRHKTQETYTVILAKNDKTSKAYLKEFNRDIIKQLPIKRKCTIVGFKKGEVVLKIEQEENIL